MCFFRGKGGLASVLNRSVCLWIARLLCSSAISAYSCVDAPCVLPYTAAEILLFSKLLSTVLLVSGYGEFVSNVALSGTLLIRGLTFTLYKIT